jgi:hypothetical protein
VTLNFAAKRSKSNFVLNDRLKAARTTQTKEKENVPPVSQGVGALLAPMIERPLWVVLN